MPGDDPLILPGGKVDPDAVRALYTELQASGGGDSNDLPVVRFELQRDLGSRLDKYLTTRIPFMSRSQLQRLIDDGAVTVNGRTGKASLKLRLGDAVAVALPPPPSSDVTPEDIPLDVLFEDDDLIVVNKHPGIIVHPARSELGGTMINALAFHFHHRSGGALSEVGRDFARPGVVHRLDRDTTGCIVFAKTEEAHWKIARQFEVRSTDKRYLAVVHGRVEPDAHVIEAPLGPHPSKQKGYREKQVVRHDQLGKKSVTIARVRERYRLHARPVGDQEFSLVELELKTGRTHQIRVHLAHVGHPIVGDDMYGGRVFTGDGRDISRQMLHAGLLCFDHPTTGDVLAAAAPPPEDFAWLVGVLREGGVFEPVSHDAAVPLARLGLAPGLGPADSA